MAPSLRRFSCALAIVILFAAALVPAQQSTLTPDQRARRIALEAELQSLATIERKVMKPIEIVRIKAVAARRG